MEFRSESRDNSPIAHLPVKSMNKFVARGNRPVSKPYRVGRAKNAMTPGKGFTHVSKCFLFQASSSGSAGDRESGAAYALQARRLKYPLLLSTQPVDLGFDHLAQISRYLQINILARLVEFPASALTRY